MVKRERLSRERVRLESRGNRPLDIPKLKLSYWYHKSSANYRKIPFLLTFDQWLKIWLDSGFLSKRGRCGNDYVMGRIGDVGPYSVDNVRIITQIENIREGRKGRRDGRLTRLQKSRAHKGKKHSDATKLKVSLIQQSRPDVLKYDTVVTIRTMYLKTRVSVVDLSSMFNASYYAVYDALVGNTYKHIPGAVSIRTRKLK